MWALVPNSSKADDVSSPVVAPADATDTRRPIVLRTFGRDASAPAYRWPIVFSVVLHVTLIGLTLWLNRKVVLPRLVEPVATHFRSKTARPPPREPATKPEALRKGGRGISLPKAVSQDTQPEAELSFASQSEPATGETGRWVGGVGSGNAGGPGWSNGVESGAIIHRSLARDPQELNTGWECGFPEGQTDRKVVVGIRIHVSDTGRPLHVTIVRPGPPAFNASAIECALRERFHPALDMRGNPVEGDRQLGILFVPQGTHAFANEVLPLPPKPPPPPPMAGPQPDLPVQLDESPNPEETPPQG